MTKFAIDAVSLNLADQIASQALSLSHALAQLCLYVHPVDGVTVLESALKILPENESDEPDSYQIRAGKTGSIGSTYLTNEQALLACYGIRAKLGSYRPLGAEIIQTALPARSAIDTTVGQILMLDWSKTDWNSQLMAIVARYRALVLSISRTSTAFAEADEAKDPQKYIQLIRESLIPECHKIAALLIRSYLPVVASARETILADASETLLEFDRLWSQAQMPLLKFAMPKSFQNIPGKTRELLLSKEDLADVREDLPEIFASFVKGLKTPKSREEMLASISEASHYTPDNFRMVSEFADLIDFLKASSNFDNLDSLVMLNYNEMILTISLIKMDLIELALELSDSQYAQPLRTFFSALTFTTTKLSYSNGQLINEVRGTELGRDAAES